MGFPVQLLSLSPQQTVRRSSASKKKNNNLLTLWREATNTKRTSTRRTTPLDWSKFVSVSGFTTAIFRVRRPHTVWNSHQSLHLHATTGWKSAPMRETREHTALRCWRCPIFIRWMSNCLVTRTHGKRPGRQRGLRASLWPILKWSRPNRQGGQERRGGENGRRSKEPARRLIWDGPRVGQNNHAQTTLSLGKQQTDGNAQADTTSQSTLEDPQQSWPHDPKWHRGCCCCGCCC